VAIGRQPRHGRHLWFAVPLALGAALPAVPVAIALDEWVAELAAYAVPSAFLLGAGAGRLLTAKTVIPRLERAIGGGSLVALLSHFGMSALFMLAHLLRGQVIPFGQPVTILFYGLLSLILFGWLTLPIGAGCGALAWYLRRWRLRRR
jgi:hypothetical protein